MRRLSAIVLSIAAVPGAAPAVAPDLPAWQPGEREQLEQAGWVAGGLLLAGETETADATATANPALEVARPTAEEIAETESPPQEIPEAFWQAYFEERPTSFLVDPQELLSPANHRDRLGFLNYHAGDSLIDLFVYVFQAGQEIPSEVREEEMMERLFSAGRPAAVIHYYLSEPQRSTLHLSPDLMGSIPPAEQRRALESSVMQAFERTAPPDQFEAFLVQISIRLYWMERMFAGTGGAMPEMGAHLDAAAEPAPENPGGLLLAALAPWLERSKPYLLPVSSLTFFSLAGLAVMIWTGRRARYHFPEFEVEPRLGGGHAAGIGAVISFASASLPPASQRDQVPDYLRRM